MQTDLDRTAGTLLLEPDSRPELEAFARELTERKAFLVPLAEQLPIGTRLAVTLRHGDDFELALEAEVMHLFDSVSGDYGTACRLLSWSEERERELAARLAGEAVVTDPEADDPPPAGTATGAPATAGADDAEVDESETRGASPIHRIREMNVSQRAILATRAGRQERQILLRDTSAQVLQSLVANPRLEAREVLRIVRTTHVTAPTLERIARDPRWGKNREILSTIASNPKTPSPLAVRLMASLRTPDLRRMAKFASGLRENVRRAALREYIARTGRS